MTLVNAETGEVVAALSPADARALTESIKGSAQRLYQLVLEAHEGQAHKALGYATWELYCRTEFNFERAHAYRLIDQGRVIRAIEQAAGVSPYGDISEAAARDIKPHLAEVADSISKRVEVEVDERADENEQAEKRLRIVAEEVTKAREKPKPVRSVPDLTPEQIEQGRAERLKTAAGNLISPIVWHVDGGGINTAAELAKGVRAQGHTAADIARCIGFLTALRKEMM